MKFPATREDMVANGYVYSNDAYCRGCHEPVEWWINNNGNKQPFTVQQIKDETKTFPQPVLGEVRIPHHGVCPNVEDFRKKK